MISATYAYGAKVFRPESRAMRLTIFDGIDMMASVAGAVLAPIIKNNCGLYACFGLKCGVDLLSLVYGFLYIKESKKNIVDPIKCAIKRIISIFN